MYRDFSDRAQNELLGLVSEVENEKLSNFTDWVGDRWYDFESWIGELNIKNYINSVNEYHKKVIDKNNATKSSIDAIFKKVKSVDALYKNALAGKRSQLLQWQRYIDEMSQIVNPQNGKFNVDSIPISLNEILRIIQQIQLDDDVKNVVYTILKLNGEDYNINIDDFLKDTDTFIKILQQSTGVSSVYENSPTFSIVLLKLLSYLKENNVVKNIWFGETTDIDVLNHDVLKKDTITLIKKASDIFSFVDNTTQDAPKSIGLIGDILGYIGSLSNSLDSDESIYSRYLNFLDLGSNSINILSGVYDFVKEDNVSKELGIVGAVCSVFTNIMKLKDYDDSKILMECGDLLGAFTTLADKGSSYILKIDGGAMSVTDKINKKANISALVSLMTMATCFIGNVMYRTNDDGVYDINDYGDTLLDTGIKGGSTLVKGITFGVVDIDNNRATDIFNENIATTTNFINNVGDSIGAPTWVKAAVTVPAAGVVSAWSIGEVFVDYGMQIGNSIMNLKNNLF